MKTKLVTLLLVGLLVGHLAGLAQNKPASDEKVQKLYNQSQPAAGAQPAAPAPAEAAAPAEAPGQVLPLVQFQDSPLLDVIKNMARQANLNVIFDPKVTDTATNLVSIRLENVTAENVLEAVLNNNNLRLERDVKTKISRVTVKGPPEAEPLVTRIYQLQYTSPSNMVAIISTSFSGGRGKAIPDGRTSQLIVQATEKDLLDIDNLIKRLDTATRQVLIEARIYETSRNPNSIKGINWEGTFGAQNFRFGNALQSAGGGGGGGGGATASVRAATNEVGLPLVPGTGTALLVDTAKGFNPKTAFLDADGVRGVLSWFNKDNETEVVSTPRTVTLDNEPAVLNVTRAFPIFKVTTGGTQSGTTVDITYTNIGTILTVTPRISASSNIRLEVVPEVSNIDSKDSQVENGQEFTANIYAIRRVKTQVLIPSGNTLVMGGLISDNITQGRTKVPVLGDLPGLGYVFRSNTKARNKVNLILFITPTIVTDEDFQLAPTDFLKKKPSPDRPESDEGPFTNPILDSAKPHDWSKPVY